MVIGIIAAIAVVLSVVLCLCTSGFGSLVWLWLLPLGWLGAFFGILLLLFLMVLVMCAFVASLYAGEPVSVTDAQAIGKSYPDFTSHVAALGGRFDEKEDIR